VDRCRLSAAVHSRAHRSKAQEFEVQFALGAALAVEIVEMKEMIHKFSA
jgi:hypothetical protein